MRKTKNRLRLARVRPTVEYTGARFSGPQCTIE